MLHKGKVGVIYGSHWGYTAVILGLHRGNIGVIQLYKDNGKENGNYLPTSVSEVHYVTL